MKKLRLFYPLFVFCFYISFTGLNAQISKSSDYSDDNEISINEFKSIFDTTQIKSLPKVYDKKIFNDYRYARMTLKSSKTIRGRILAFHKKGIYFFNQKTAKINYINYTFISEIMMGRSYGHVVFIGSVVSSGLGFVIGATEGMNAALGGLIAGPLIAASFGNMIMSPLNDFLVSLKNANWKIDYNKTAFNQFYQYISAVNATGNITKEILPNDTSINVPKQVEIVTNENNIETKETIGNKESEIVTQVEPTVDPKVEPKKAISSHQNKLKKIEFGKPSSINAAWIITNFNGKEVNESALVQKYRNISGILLIESELQKYNSSSLQFLAMIICTSPGYDFKNIEALNDDQKKVLYQYEPMITEPVTLQSKIARSNLDEYAEKNLLTIYQVLIGKNN
jgi:hypothetical protein